MATYRSGANAQIVIGKEASFNTLPSTPVGHILRKASFTFNGIKERIQNNELRADPNPAPDETGMQKVTAQLVVPVTTDDFGLLLYFFLGSYAVSGSGPYTHTFKVDATAVDTCWVEVGDIELDKFDLFAGLAVSSISLGTISKGSSNLLMATVDFVASGLYELNNDDDSDATPTAANENRIHVMPACSVEVDTAVTALIQEITCTMSRTITMSGVLDGTLYNTDVDHGKYMYDVTIKGWRDSADTIFGYDDSSQHQVEIISPRPGGTYSITIVFPEADIFQSEDSGQVSGDGPVFATARVAPHYTDNADGTSLKVVIVGEVASYVTLVG